MMDPISTKAVTPAASDTSSEMGVLQLPKEGASQFDKVRAQLQATADTLNSSASKATSDAAPMPPPSTVVQPVDSGAKSDVLSARLQSIPSFLPGPEKIQQAITVGRYHLDNIQSTVKANSSNSTMDKVKGKLNSIEAQYNQLDVTLQQISPDATPQDWLRLQLMANSMNENISVLSKLVDSASSGVKTILQTQI